MSKEKCCGTCKRPYAPTERKKEWLCGNENADGYGAETDYSDGDDCED